MIIQIASQKERVVNRLLIKNDVISGRKNRPADNGVIEGPVVSIYPAQTHTKKAIKIMAFYKSINILTTSSKTSNYCS